ncbi:alpha/beta fold hydrolase [soil metagenome]
MILLHGYGSNGADLIAIGQQWRAALPDTLFVAPNAPELCPGAPGGYQWWALEGFSRQALAAGVARATPALDAFIDKELADAGLTDADLLLVGFSQGTMMALHAGPRRAHPIAGIIGYSGMLADVAGLEGATPSRPPVLLVHGTADQVVPFAAMGEAEAQLRRQGFDVRTHAAPGLGHGVDPTGLDLGLAFARERLGSA